MMNRLHNVRNPHQGNAKKVLCVCSAGLLRSPTLAHTLSAEPYNYNTRAVGVSAEYALVPVDAVMLAWADEVVCVEPDVRNYLLEKWGKHVDESIVKTLNLPDRFPYRDPELVELIKQQYEEV